jgi:hypothetical protein
MLYTVAEGLRSEPTGAAQSRISYGDLDKNIKHSLWLHRVNKELNRVRDMIICSKIQK